jgi:hypothetical protein
VFYTRPALAVKQRKLRTRDRDRQDWASTLTLYQVHFSTYCAVPYHVFSSIEAQLNAVHKQCFVRVTNTRMICTAGRYIPVRVS